MNNKTHLAVGGLLVFVAIVLYGISLYNTKPAEVDVQAITATVKPVDINALSVGVKDLESKDINGKLPISVPDQTSRNPFTE